MNNPAEKSFDYMAEAHLTASPHYYGDLVPFEFYRRTLHECIEALQKLDRIKKALFYGRDPEIINIGPDGRTMEAVPVYIGMNCAVKAPEACRNLLHGIIGKATETGELLEALYATTVEGLPFDTVNVVEETGDGFWYDSLTLGAVGSNFGEAQWINIDKLRRRFPQRFTEYDANNRDLIGEREVLEYNRRPPQPTEDGNFQVPT